jgi:diaminohydroxyphosphoribosylaminopyrimidine deaminase/5-amino-6-(5-phosphoribosylamino)uracil reductase
MTAKRRPQRAAGRREAEAEAEVWMRRALDEAERGRGRTHPNPIVGAVVVKGGKLVSAGFHAQAGGPHAEAVALEAAGRRAEGSDLYVTLEPCSHHGRTPPCTDAIRAAGIRRVFVGSRDPNPHVSGRGAARLRRAGLEVTLGVLGAACDAANEAWFKYILRGRPWVVLKAAVTLDGQLATAAGDSRWVTSERSRQVVHRLRDELDAVLVGVGTACADDPRLTARLDPARGDGQPGAGQVRPARDPVRVVVDSQARLHPDARMLTQRSLSPTLVACTDWAPRRRVHALERAGARIVRCRAGAEGRVELDHLLEQLAARGLTSVLVEGGAVLHGSFLREQRWDELLLFVAPKLAGAGGRTWAGFAGVTAMAESLPLRIESVAPVDGSGDLLLRARPVSCK